MTATVTFDCGHIVTLPHDSPLKYWNDQSVPQLAGAVAACPGCATKRREKGELRRVVAVESHAVVDDVRDVVWWEQQGLF